MGSIGAQHGRKIRPRYDPAAPITEKRDARRRLMAEVARRAEEGEQLKSIALDVGKSSNTLAVWMQVMGYKRVYRKVP